MNCRTRHHDLNFSLSLVLSGLLALCHCQTPALPLNTSCYSSQLWSPKLLRRCSPPSRWHSVETNRCTYIALLAFSSRSALSSFKEINKNIPPCSGEDTSASNGRPRLPAWSTTGGPEALATFHWWTENSWSGRTVQPGTDLHTIDYHECDSGIWEIKFHFP